MQQSTSKFWILKIGFVLSLFLSVANAESLRYNIKWPSGLSLGEATLAGSGLSFTFDIDASVPGFAIRDHYLSNTTASFCTVRFEREAEHGRKKTNERIVVSPEGKIRRETVQGGATELFAGPCPHDALALLFALRLNLQQGSLPVPQTVLFGPGYPVRFERAGAETISVSDKPSVAEKIVCVLTLPKTGDYRIEMFFLQDAARTPALLRAPFVLGTFSMELVR